jgi:glucose dehydrogenase
MARPEPLTSVTKVHVFRVGGWVYAVDADTGAWKWRLKSNYPTIGDDTTVGGVVF